MAVIQTSMMGTVVADKWYVRPVFVTIENLAPSSPCGCTAITMSMMLITPLHGVQQQHRHQRRKGGKLDKMESNTISRRRRQQDGKVGEATACSVHSTPPHKDQVAWQQPSRSATRLCTIQPNNRSTARSTAGRQGTAGQGTAGQGRHAPFC